MIEHGSRSPHIFISNASTHLHRSALIKQKCKTPKISTRAYFTLIILQNMSPTPTIRRPYTSYNLYFQLEREYILQKVFGYTPTVARVFDPADQSNYDGPPLPHRYRDLILPYDWHLPGKTQRRKRSHRKTHGKIGLHDLNERVSKAWAVVDDETRKFCVALSSIESKKYKKAIQSPPAEKAEIKTKKSESDKVSSIMNGMELMRSFETKFNVTPELGSNSIYHPVSHETNNEDVPQASSTTLPDCLALVDMCDDEIMAIWHSIPSEKNERELSVRPDSSRESPAESPSALAEYGTRKYFIEKEYEQFREIGQQFLNKQRLMRRLSSQLMRNGYAAREA